MFEGSLVTVTNDCNVVKAEAGSTVTVIVVGNPFRLYDVFASCPDTEDADGKAEDHEVNWGGICGKGQHSSREEVNRGNEREDELIDAAPPGGRTLPSAPIVHPLGSPLMDVYVTVGLTDVTATPVFVTQG